MELVGNLDEIMVNLKYLDAARLGSDENKETYLRLIQRGTCFLTYLSDNVVCFAPSKFIGHKDNTFTKHASEKLYSGTATNDTLNEILEEKCKINPALEAAYRSFCKYLGFEPNPLGTAGNVRKYWILPGASAAVLAINLGNSAEQINPTSIFTVGQRYSREKVAELIGLPMDKRKGNWATGYPRYKSSFFIFANIGTTSRTGHSYGNRWENRSFIWSGKDNSTERFRETADLLSGDFATHVFWRTNNRGDFTYAGLGRASTVSVDNPLQVRWIFEPIGCSDDKPGDQSPRTRRGPPPTPGTIAVTRTAGETFAYLMKLDGSVGAVFPSLPRGGSVVKIGVSNNPERRRDELCWGFPLGCTLTWRIVRRRLFGSARDAYDLETKLLEVMRIRSVSFDGEFAVVDGLAYETLDNLVRGISTTQ